MTEEQLIIKYEKLIYKIAKRFYNVELSDLYQAGCIGLIKAYRKYNKESNSNFINFAYMHIFGEMYELSNKTRDIKLNKAYLSLYKKILEYKNKYASVYGIEPSIEEISNKTNIDINTISEILFLTTKMLSIEHEYQSINDGKIKIEDYLGTTLDTDNQILIRDSLETLEPLEQDVIRIRYFEDMTQSETARVLGISQVKVSRLESKGKSKIKEYIAA